jgi:phage N-6-adenine-methyltransferase
MTRSALARAPKHGSLSKYDPEKGLKAVAVLEAAEKHFARAKDATKLQQAIRGKLEAQAEFVLWWDTKGPGTNHGGDRKGDRSKSPTADFEPERLKRTISRWRGKLNDPAKFETTYETAVARYLKIVELEQSAHVSNNSGENEWYTPVEFIEAARDVLGDIDLDPASSDAANEVVKAAEIFTAKDNGLLQPWHGRIWLNPPYSQPLISQFAEKFAASVAARDVASGVVLVNNATETEWFATLAAVAVAICFPKGRIRFWSPNKTSATPLQGQAFLYAGEQADKFCSRFAEFGIVTRVVRGVV